MNSEKTLIKLSKEGNKNAFETLVIKYQDKLMGSLNKLFKNPTFSEDIAQEAFIKAYINIGGFKEDSAFFTWLYRIAVNTAKNYLSSKYNKNEIIESEIDENILTQIGIDSPSPESILEANTLRDRLFECLNDMPEEIKSAITLREFNGLNYEEIAKICSCPVGTVRSRIFRGRQLLDEIQISINNEAKSNNGR